MLEGKAEKSDDAFFAFAVCAVCAERGRVSAQESATASANANDRAREHD